MDHKQEQLQKESERQKLRKKIHRTLFEARKALHEGDEEKARIIIKQMMVEATPAAVKASKEHGFNWVVEELKILDELLLPDE